MFRLQLSETGYGDKLLLATTVGLVLFGILMVYSASAVMAQSEYNNQFYFFSKQAFSASLGFLSMMAVTKIDYKHLKNPLIVYGLIFVVIFFLTLVLLLPAVKGTHRFIRIPGFSFQPSELAKIALVIFLAYFLEKRAGEIRDLKRTFIPVVIISGFLMGMVLLGKDLGTTLIMGLVTTVMLVVSGVPIRYMGVCVLPVLPLLYWQLFHVAYRFERLKAFLDPWQYARDEGFQVVQSLIAVGSGGVDGLGLSQGKQKLFYLPEAHTDFIYAVIGEELGLIGAGVVVLLFLLFLWRGIKSARHAPDMFGCMLALGFCVMIVSQAFFNMSVVLSLVPAKGIPLPFISYGGTSIIFSLIGVGIILNVSNYINSENS
jgi:cell division protein FtsW